MIAAGPMNPATHVAISAGLAAVALLATAASLFLRSLKPFIAPDSPILRNIVKVLFLHGWHSVPGGVKPSYFIRHGHEVINPALPDDDFDAAVRLAQTEFDHHAPEVIVGSSRGGAIAMAIQSNLVPLVLLCPAWKRWGAVRVAKPNTTILHSRNDEVIPFGDSEELVAASGLPRTALIETGNDHRLADPDSLRTMLHACLRATEGLCPSND